jgi:predicted CxxxxCH...CXXCH cytochrome family protein
LQGEKTVHLAPHGQCERCSNWFHFKGLQTPAGKSAPKWPIRYLGYTCKKCHREFMAGR